MSKTRYALAVAAAAGMIGAWAPAAFAGTVGSGNGSSAGVVNVNGNQVPVQVCNNNVPVNGVGGQVPVSDIVGALGLLSGPSVITAANDRSCHQASAQANANGSVDPAHSASDPARMTMRGKVGAWHMSASNSGNGRSAGVVNVNDNQVPVQGCGNNVPVNAVGGQVPVSDVAGALGLLNSGITSARTNASCHQPSVQGNANG